LKQLVIGIELQLHKKGLASEVDLVTLTKPHFTTL